MQLGSRYGRQAKTFTFENWPGGYNAHSPAEVSAKEFSLACNFKPRQKGGWETRQGSTRFTNTPAPGEIGAIEYFPAAGKVICAAKDGATWKLYYLDATNDPILVGSLDGKPSLKNFNGKLHVADGTQIMDCTTAWVLADVVGAPKASQLSTLYNRLLATGDPDNPSTFWYTDVKDTAEWNQEFIDDADGDSIVGHVIHKGQDIYFFKGPHKKSIHRLTGFRLPGTMVRERIYEGGGGALCQPGIVSSGDDLIWPAKEGFLSLRKLQQYEGDYSEAVVSDNIAPVYKKYADANLIGGYCTEDGLCLFQCASATYPYLLVYDSVRQVWGRYRFAFNAGATVYPSAFASIGGVTYIGATNGHIYTLGASQFKDDGNSYAAHTFARSAYTDFGLPHHNKLTNQLGFYFHARKGATFNLRAYKDYSYGAFYDQVFYLPITGDVTVDELDLVVDDWTFPFDPSYALAKDYRVSWRWRSIMMGIENVQPTSEPMVIGALSLKGALLRR